MLSRWNTKVGDLSLILAKLREITRRTLPCKKSSRERKPKHKLGGYITLSVLINKILSSVFFVKMFGRISVERDSLFYVIQ